MKANGNKKIKLPRRGRLFRDEPLVGSEGAPSDATAMPAHASGVDHPADVQPKKLPPKETLEDLGEIEVGVTRNRPARKRYVPRSFVVSVTVIALVLFGVVGYGAYLYYNQTVAIPSLIGQTVDEAVTNLRHYEMRVGKVTRATSSAPEGVIVSQNPAAGTQIEENENTPVDVMISAGPDVTIVPAVVGVSETLAVGKLYTEGIPYDVNYLVSAEESGTVLAVSPPEGTEVADGEAVTLSVALSGTAVQRVVPYDMREVTVVLDPAKTMAKSSRDVPLEVANKIQGLVEASGGKVVVTRSALTAADDFTAAKRKKAAKGATVVVSLGVTKKGAAGLQALSLRKAPNKQAEASSGIAGYLAKNLEDIDYPIIVNLTESDSLNFGSTYPWINYILGNMSVRSDTARFATADFSTYAARAIYVAIGQQFELKLLR